MELQIQGTVHTKVSIDPIRVIEELINSEIGWRGWIKEKGGKYYQMEEVSFNHLANETNEITKEHYDYIKSLQNIKKYLQNNKELWEQNTKKSVK